MGHASRKALFFAITTALAVGLAAASPAAAMKPTITFAAPSPAEGATLSSDAVSFAFGYNKKPNATAALSCVLSGQTSSSDACDAPVASGKKGSRSGTSYRALANGSYALTITLTLTDGGKASATRHFTVDVPPGSGTPGHVYWANASTGTIGRANLDGTDVDQSFITGGLLNPVGVAVDANYVYWADPSTDAIGRANLDGTGANPSFITDVSDPLFVAVDANYVYWTNLFTSWVGRANLDGTGAKPSFIAGSGALDVVGVAVDADHVYWTKIFTDTIARANLDGTGVNQLFITGASEPVGVAVNAG